jgi:hypothetical protein
MEQVTSGRSPSRTERHRKPPILTRLLLSLAAILLALPLAEVTLRLLPPSQFPILAAVEQRATLGWEPSGWRGGWAGVLRPHPILGVEHEPDVDMNVPRAEHPDGAFRLRTNNLGLRRDDDTPIEKAPNVFRVLVLGDSHAFGYVHNSETFSTLLETGLARRLAPQGKRVEVLNAGVATYSPAQEVLWYKVHGVQLEPDLVLLLFYPGNDISDLADSGRPRVDVTTGQAVQPREAQPADNAVNPFEQLRLGLLAGHAIAEGPLAEPWQWLGLPGRQARPGGYPPETLARVFRTCAGCYWQSLYQAARAHHDPRTLQASLSQAGQLLSWLNRDVRDNAGRLVVAVLPTRRQVEPALARADRDGTVAQLLSLSPSDLAFDDEVVRTMLGYLTAAGVGTVSLQDSLRKATHPDRPLYYSRDWHLNVRGNQVVATALEQASVILSALPSGTGRTLDTNSARRGDAPDSRPRS